MTLLARISRLELAAAAVAAVALAALVALEPDILAAPFASRTALLFTVGGTLAAAVAYLAMLRAEVTPAVRFAVLAAPFLAVNWWLLSPYFRDEVVTEAFAVSIADAASPTVASTAPPAAGAGAAGAPGAASTAVAAPSSSAAPAADAAPTPDGQPVLRGAGTFSGLAGHDGTGDAAVFRLPDGGHVLRFERFDIDNGPDLRVYLVPGAGQTAPGAGAIYLGELRGNVGDQTYPLPAGTALEGPVTALVWCEAFGVEFVAATLQLS